MVQADFFAYPRFVVGISCPAGVFARVGKSTQLPAWGVYRLEVVLELFGQYFCQLQPENKY